MAAGTVLRLGERDHYSAALDAASNAGDIQPFVAFVAFVDDSLAQSRAAQVRTLPAVVPRRSGPA